MPEAGMIVERCPHCGTRHVDASVIWQSVLPAEDEQWWVVACNNAKCRRVILVTTDRAGTQPRRQFPGGRYEIDEHIPVGAEIRSEFREAATCLGAGCYRASLVMSRRALQRILKEQGCPQRNLGGDEGALEHAIASGILRKPLHALAREIKEYGNLGAHPDDEQLESADHESAAHVLRFLDLIVGELYEVPDVAQQLTRKRTQGGDPSGQQAPQ